MLGLGLIRCRLLYKYFVGRNPHQDKSRRSASIIVGSFVPQPQMITSKSLRYLTNLKAHNDVFEMFCNHNLCGHLCDVPVVSYGYGCTPVVDR